MANTAAATRTLKAAKVTRVIAHKGLVVADSAVGTEVQAQNFAAALAALDAAGTLYVLDADYPGIAELV